MPVTRSTLADVAAAAGVSKATVSAVLNAPATVRVATRERVLAALDRLNYRPGPTAGAAVPRSGPRAAPAVARGAAAPRGIPGVIGLLVKEADNPYYAGIVTSARAVADARGYTLLVASSEGDAEAERRAVEALHAHEAAGLLVTPVLDEAADLSPYFALRRRGVPLVLLEEVRGLPASLVDVDNARAACDAAEHLIGLGHTRLAHFAGPAYSLHSQQRAQGVRRACSNAGLVFGDGDVVAAGAHLEDGYRAALAYFGDGGGASGGGRAAGVNAVTGVTCYNDLVAVGVCRALQELGLRVPDDVSVVGFDDVPVGRYLATPLTTVRVPLGEMGRRAAELLLARVEAPGGAALPPERHVLAAPLVVRASTRPPAATTPARARAGSPGA